MREETHREDLLVFVQQVLQSLGLPVEEMTSVLWPDDPAARMQERAERWNASLRRRFAGLVGQRRAIEGLRYRVAEEEKRVARLTAGLQDLYVRGDEAAWAHSVELEQAQLRLGRARASIERREGVYQEGLDVLKRGRRKVARLREQILAGGTA